MFKEPLARWSAALQPQVAPGVPLAKACQQLIAKTMPAARCCPAIHAGGPGCGDPGEVRLFWGQTRADPARSYATLGPGGGLVTGREPPGLTAQIIDEIHRTGGFPQAGSWAAW